jgi:calcineurin-like phosphoesterase family protein
MKNIETAVRNIRARIDAVAKQTHKVTSTGKVVPLMRPEFEIGMDIALQEYRRGVNLNDFSQVRLGYTGIMLKGIESAQQKLWDAEVADGLRPW